MVSVAFLVVLALAAIAGPWIVPNGPLTQNLDQALQLPGWQHWLGTDDLGRDLLSRLLLGTRVSLKSASASALLALVVGTGCGLLAGYQPGLAECAHHAGLGRGAGVSGGAARDAGGDHSEDRPRPA